MADSQIAHGPTLAANELTAPPEGERLAVGASAGDYVVERFLGAGAMGDVYAGRHPVIGKRVAIKVLKRELAASSEAAERFTREARAVNQIDHPNVIDVFGFGRLDDGRLYLVMDLVDGRSLRAAVQDGPLAVEAALDVLAKIAEALDAAHSRGVIHRDLKPDNVMLTDTTPPKVFVLDFGIAKLFTEGGAIGNGTLTGKGTWLGTPGYMAPEQWSADGAGPASDRYALGVMAYELLSGVLPFQAPTLPQMMEQHFRAPVPALSARGKVMHHQTLDPVLARAMAKSPEARFSTARDLVEALRDAAAGKAVVRAGRRSMMMPAVAGASVLGLAIVGFLVVRSPRSEDARTDRTDPMVAPAGFVRIQVITLPRNASVTKDGQLVGSTPITTDVRVGTVVSIQITKPGYRSISEQLSPGKDAVVHKDLEAINSFEGVWAMPDGQLRGFKRVDEHVEVYKLVTVTGEGEFWRKFELVEPPPGAGGVVFATNAELTDDRGMRDPSCQISHKIEYRFDPEHEALDVRAERVETARQDGRCIVRTRMPGTPTKLVRADRDSTDTRWSQPPVGKPVKADNLKLPNDSLDNAFDVPQKNVPTITDEKLDAKLQKQGPPPNKVRPPKRAPKNVGNVDAPASKESIPQPPTPQRQAPEPIQANPPPQPQVNLPQAPTQVPPRGDSQVAPQDLGQQQRKN